MLLNKSIIITNNCEINLLDSGNIVSNNMLTKRADIK